jgi:hypothetical protein
MENEKHEVNEAPLLNPGMITNATTEQEPDKELIDELLERNEENDESPMPATGVKLDKDEVHE